MPEISLARKLKLKPGHRAAVISAPERYLQELGPLPPDTVVVEKLEGTFDWVQVFVKSRAELEKLAPQAIRALKPESLLWISFPKGTSKVQTDLTRDQGWEVIRQADLKWVNLIMLGRYLQW